jgi:hypothetical protein
LRGGSRAASRHRVTHPRQSRDGNRYRSRTGLVQSRNSSDSGQTTRPSPIGVAVEFNCSIPRRVDDPPASAVAVEFYRVPWATGPDTGDTDRAIPRARHVRPVNIRALRTKTPGSCWGPHRPSRRALQNRPTRAPTQPPTSTPARATHRTAPSRKNQPNPRQCPAPAGLPLSTPVAGGETHGSSSAATFICIREVGSGLPVYQSLRGGAAMSARAHICQEGQS